MKSKDIAELVFELINDPEVKRYMQEQNIKIIIRTDNGTQFIANSLAKILESISIVHEFIQPATPHQNTHIESFHSTVERLVYRRNIFRDLKYAYYYHYAYELGTANKKPKLISTFIMDKNEYILSYIRFESGMLNFTKETIKILKQQ